MYSNNRKNQYDRKDSLEIGDKAEEVFKNLMENKGYTAKKSTKDEDINDHWDYEFSNAEKKFKVDIKARKRLNRNSNEFQDDWIWIELHSVRQNNKGWLLDGKADYISFETENNFIMVERKLLIDLVKSKVDFQSSVTRAQEAKYKLYSRAGRCDSLTLIQSKDILSIQHEIINKEK